MRFLKMLLLSSLCFSVEWSHSAAKTIQQKQVKLRQKPAFLAPSIAELKYLDVVIVLEEKKTWSKVESKNNKKLRGWIPSSSLTVHSPVKIKNTSQVDLSEGAVALAGKGFSAEHEKAFKNHNQKLDFSKVDQVERLSLSDEQLKIFVKASGFKAAKPKGRP